MRTGPCALRLAALVLLVVCLTYSADIASDHIVWRNLGPGAGGNMFSSAISPADPRIVLMGSDVGGIYRTGDGGQTWSLRNNALVDPARHNQYGTQNGTFAFHPQNPNIVYFGSLKSVDAGLTWTEMVDNPIIGALTTIDASNPNTIYVAAYGQIYKTEDDFANGEYMEGEICTGDGTDCPTSCIPRGSNHECGNQEVVIHSLIIDPDTPSHLLACVSSHDGVPCDVDHCGLFESTEGGAEESWNRIDVGITPAGSLPEDFRCNQLAIHVPTRTLYMSVGTSYDTDATGWRVIDSWKGGVYKSSGSPFGHSWVSFNGEGSAHGNVMPNYGFELQNPGSVLECDPDPPPSATTDRWTNAFGTIRRITTFDRNNVETCALRTGNGTNSEGGVLSDCIALQGGEVYEASAWAKLEGYGGCGGPLSLTFQGQYTFFSDSNCSTLQQFPGMGTFNSNPWVDASSTYDAAVNNGWRLFTTQLRPPTNQTVYARLTLDALSNPGCAGHTYLDDVSLRQIDSLPKVGGSISPTFVFYGPLVVDPYNADTVYVGTTGGSIPDFQVADTAGVWKSSVVAGVTHWEHVTRANHGDNVEDGIYSAPKCGNGFCEGRWENCDTCPDDCAGSSFPDPPACCGDHQCDNDETVDSCRVDCPAYPVTGRTYDEYASPGPQVWTLAIGKDEPVENPPVPDGSETLYFGSEPTRTVNGGELWTMVTSDYAIPSEAVTAPSWQARGDLTDVDAFPVVEDHRGPLNMVFYGDGDNRLQVSYDDGDHFAQEGLAAYTIIDDVTMNADSVTSIVLDPNFNPNTYDPDEDDYIIYAGTSCGDASYQLTSNCAAIVQGTYTPEQGDEVGRWVWAPYKDQSAIGKQGSVELFRTSGAGGSTPTFMAAVYTQGLFRLVNDVWTQTGITWDHEPNGKELYRLIQEPSTGRLYLGVGDPYSGGGLSEGSHETGIWEGSPDGASWCKISDATLYQEPVVTLAAPSPTTLFAGTFDFDGGGAYKGTRQCSCGQPGCTQPWTWDRVLDQHKVASIVVSPASSSILYAYVGQVGAAFDVPGQYAGIYKSTQGGDDNTWFPLDNDGLMYLGFGRLAFSSGDPKTLYATTMGSGLFVGEMTCGEPIEGFVDTDLDGDADCADTDDDNDGVLDANDCGPLNPQIGIAEVGTSLSTCFDGLDNDCDGDVDLDCGMNVSSEIVNPGTPSGSTDELAALSSNNVYEVLTEGGSGSSRQLKAIWTIPIGVSLSAGTTCDLRVEGFRNSSSNDTFNFSFSTRSTSGSCTASEGGSSVILNVSATSDNDQLRAADLGMPSNSYCVKAVDSKVTGDSVNDSLSLDRLFVFPSPIALSDHAATGDVGTVTAGSFVSTQRSEDTRESLREELSGGSYRLWHTWKFQNVPAGAGHKLHAEGYRTVGAGGKLDDFQFYWSTDPASWSSTNPTTGFTLISGSVISSSGDVAIDSSSFGSTLSGTVYIRVIDLQKSQTATWQNTLNLDHLAIKTTP